MGYHERSGMPVPEHISARWQDLFPLIDGLIATNQLLKESDFDAVLAATIIAFGFVFIHPLEDGNGRLHRYLIHHVLAEKKLSPDNIIFPVSAVTGLWTNFDLNGSGPVGEPEPARAPNSDKLQSNPDY